MLFKCIGCKKRESIVSVESVATMAGTVKLRFCAECSTSRAKIRKEQEEQSRKSYEAEQKERAKQRRYEYLKREIELMELEEKVKFLGIE